MEWTIHMGRSSKGRMTANADKDTALLASPAEAALAAELLLRERYNFVPLEEAEQIIALGGDGQEWTDERLHGACQREPT